MRTLSQIAFAPDPAVPARELLLDPRALGDHLEQITGCPVDAIERVRVKYRIGESLRVLSRITSDGVAHLVASRTFPEARVLREASRATAVAVPARGFQGVIACPETQAVFWALPNDRRLRGLDRVLRDPATLVPSLRGRWRASEPVAWSPERCLTVRCLDADGELLGYAKAYTDVAAALSVVARYHAIARLLRGTGLRVPTILGWSAEPPVVVLSPAAGAPPQGIEGVFALGAALGRVHTLAPPPLAAFGRLRPDRIANTAHLIGLARPDCADTARALADAVARSRPAAAAQVLLHGDVHSANVLVADGEATLIDFDQAGIGPAACDLGSALARHIRDRVAERVDPAAAGSASRALLDGYASVRALPSPRDIVWHTSAALLAECGMRAVNRLHDDVLPVLERVLEAGLDHLSAGDV